MELARCAFERSLSRFLSLFRSHLFDAQIPLQISSTRFGGIKRVPYRYLTATSKYKFRLRINELPLSVLMLLLLLQFGFEPTSTLNTESLAHSLFPVHSIGFYHFGTQTYTPNEEAKKKKENRIRLFNECVLIFCADEAFIPKLNKRSPVMYQHCTWISSWIRINATAVAIAS